MEIMKHIAILCLAALHGIFIMPLMAQQLTLDNHLPSAIDSLQIYKLPYVPVSNTQGYCTWDFSNISSKDMVPNRADYFPHPTDSTRMGLHLDRTNYKFKHSGDTVWMIGYETSFTLMTYTTPIPWLIFPFSYGDSVGGTFQGKGEYCHTISISVTGTYSMKIEAIGQLVLPDVVADSAILLHWRKTYHQDTYPNTLVHEDRYRWFSPYARYPLFETIQTITVENNSDTTTAKRYSYYYPQEQQIPQQTSIQNFVLHNSQLVDSLITNIAYMPNPVSSDLHISYTLHHPAEVYISLHYNGGVTMYQSTPHHESEGEHFTQIDMSGLPIGTYVVYIHADNELVSGNIIKL